MAKYRIDYTGPVRKLPDDLMEFREKFLKEELKEYTDQNTTMALQGPSVPALADALDALVDLVYVAIGTAIYHGFDFRAAWDRVQAANMAKMRYDDMVKAGLVYNGKDIRHDHDVLKPPGWTAPDHSDLVANFADEDTER